MAIFPVSGAVNGDTFTDGSGNVWTYVASSNKFISGSGGSGSKTTVSGTAPATKNVGDAWFDTSTGGGGSLVIWNGNAWLEVIGGGGGGGDVAYGTLQEISTSGAIVLDKTTGGAWVRFFAAGGSGGGGGVYRSNAISAAWKVYATRGGSGGEISFYVPDVSVLQGSSVTFGAGGSSRTTATSNIDTSTGTSASASSWTVGAGTISLSGGTGGAIGKATTAVTAANANGTDGTITVNTSGYANDTSYNGVPNVYEDVTNFLATGVTDYITAGGEGSFGGSAIAVSTSEGPGYAIWTDPAGVAAGIRIVYDAG
tara:strand:- start:3849 stop:4784 length:936 start_codon:yes stop_codon:yes gene_type:complete